MPTTSGHLGSELRRHAGASRTSTRRRATVPAPLVVLMHSAIDPGAPTDEQDTLEQVHAVGRALLALGFRVEAMELTRNLGIASARLKRLRPALVFNLVESIDGRGEAIHLAPTLLAASTLPFTGCDTRAMLFTADKRSAKRLMTGAGIATPALFEPGVSAPDEQREWIVKSLWEDASIGLDGGSVVRGQAACASEMAERRRRFGGEWFAEAYIEGREFNIGLLGTTDGPRVLPIAEMQFVDFPPGLRRIVDYAAKWDTDSFAYRNTRRSFDLPLADGALLARLEGLALRCWEVFGLAGYARVDVRVDETGEPWVLELNANPCIAPDAGFAAAAARAGLDYTAVIASIVECARPGLLELARSVRQSGRDAA